MTHALHDKSVIELVGALTQKHVSAVELAQHFLARAQADTTGSYLALNEEATLAQAKAADARIAAGTAGTLEGVPLAHKDVFVTREFPTTAGSKILDGYRSPFDATVVAKLAEQGMVTLGKVNCDEFAMGSSNENSAYGAVKNPWDATRIPGGSSGGSAAVVAARLAPASTGTDTGGSIRQPAALCGLTGLKPSYGTVSRWGMIAFASSLDQAGPCARTVLDTALLHAAIAGHDPKDSTSLTAPVPDVVGAARRADVKGMKIGLVKELGGEGYQAGVEQRFQETVELLTSLIRELDQLTPRTKEQAVAAELTAAKYAGDFLLTGDLARQFNRAG